MIRLGKASPPWLTKIAGPSTGRIGVIALAWPIFDALGQLAGFALNCFAVPALCNVLSCEGELLGEFDFGLLDVRLGAVGVGDRGLRGNELNE
jgi:hypothetical protein